MDINSTLESFHEKTNIHLKSFVIGTIVFTVLATIGFVYKIDLLFPISAAGLIYVGYYCKNIKWGILLGIIATIPLIIITIYYKIMPYTSMNDLIMIIFSLVATGAIIGTVGAYIKSSRQRAIAQANKKGKKKKNKKNKKN